MVTKNDSKKYLTTFRSKLELIKKSPLRPQQKLWVIKTKLIPSTYHSLVLWGYSLKVLKAADTAVRGYLNKYCTYLKTHLLLHSMLLLLMEAWGSHRFTSKFHEEN